MAVSIQAALCRLRRMRLADLPADCVFEQLCHQHDHDWRERLFTPLITMKLFLLQIAWGNTAINHLRHLSGLAFVASSYCEARMRLPLGVLQGFLQKLVESAVHRGIGPVAAGFLLCLSPAPETQGPPPGDRAVEAAQGVSRLDG